MSGRMEIRGSASTIISTIIIASRPAVVNVSAGTRIETITWQTPPPPRDLTFFKKISAYRLSTKDKLGAFFLLKRIKINLSCNYRQRKILQWKQQILIA